MTSAGSVPTEAVVLDASAVLAYLQGEPGADVVAARLSGAIIGTANLSEVLSKFGSDVEVSLAQSLLAAQGAVLEPVNVDDSVEAARLRRESAHLSLGDRLCLALASRLDADVLTADRAWGSSGRVLQIR